MRQYENKAIHPFERRLDEIINSTPKDEHITNADGSKSIKIHLPHFESDESTLGEAVDWLETEARKGNIVAISQEKLPDGGMRLIAGHGPRNAHITVDLTPNGKYKRVKIF